MKALISIDYTNDFIADDGKLTTGKEGQSIEKALVSLTNDFINQGNYVVFAIDGHENKDTYHPESKLFPPHNIIGTKGRELYGGLKDVYDQHKEKDSVHWMDKRYYSAFCGTDLDTRLRERGIREIYLTGVCTDICVLHTAVDAYNLGYDLVIPKDSVQSFDQEGHTWALRHFEQTLGAKVI